MAKEIMRKARYIKLIFVGIFLTICGCTYSPYEIESYDLRDVQPKEYWKIGNHGGGHIEFDGVLFFIEFFYGPPRKNGKFEVSGGPYRIKFDVNDSSLKYTNVVIDHVQIRSSNNKEYMVEMAFPARIEMARREGLLWNSKKQDLQNTIHNHGELFVAGPYDFKPKDKETVTLITEFRAIKDGVTTRHNLTATFDPYVKKGYWQSID